MDAETNSKGNRRRVLDADVAIGERVRSRRNQIKMSQSELGDALSVSFQQIQKYEKGINCISSGRLLKLSQILKCGVCDLVGSDGKAGFESTPFSKYVASKEGVALINAMQKISSAAVRKQVITLLESLAKELRP